MSKHTKTKQKDRETSDARTTLMTAEGQKLIAYALGAEVNKLVATSAGQ